MNVKWELQICLPNSTNQICSFCVSRMVNLHYSPLSGKMSPIVTDPPPPRAPQVYLMVVLYRCVCSRNYAEWRSSWGADGRGAEDCQQQQVVLEALPLRLTGHTQQVECLETDGQLLVTCCLAGQVRVWDAITGDCVRLEGVSGHLLSGRTGPRLGRHHWRLCQVSGSVWSPAVWPDRSGCGTPSLVTVSG